MKRDPKLNALEHVQALPEGVSLPDDEDQLRRTRLACTALLRLSPEDRGRVIAAAETMRGGR